MGKTWTVKTEFRVVIYRVEAQKQHRRCDTDGQVMNNILLRNRHT